MKMRIFAGACVGFAAAAAFAVPFELVTGVNVQNYPGVNRVVPPIPGPGVPGTFNDGDRLAGTTDDGPVVPFNGIGTPFFTPNQFGATSFIFRRGSVPLGPAGQLPFMNIEFLGGPRVDFDGNPNDPFRSLVPTGATPALLRGLASNIDLGVNTLGGTITLDGVDITGNNEGGPGVSGESATIVVNLSGTDPNGALNNPPLNPLVDSRMGTLTPYLGMSGTLAGVFAVGNLDAELWEDTGLSTSSTASTLGTLQQFVDFNGWLVQADPNTGLFPVLSGEALGSTLWPAIDTSQIGNTFNRANSPFGPTATITGGFTGDDFTAVPEGVALTDFGGDLGGYLDAVVVPNLPAGATQFVYLESSGWGISNSPDPVIGSTVGYDAVLIAAYAPQPCPGDINGDRVVDSTDLSILLGNFGGPGGAAQGDVDGNGIVDSTDLAILLSVFGSTCP